MIRFFDRFFPKPQDLPKPDPKPEHVHSFELIVKTIAEPRVISSNTAEFPPEIISRVVLGVTTYLWECAECGELRKEMLLGSEEPTLPNLIAKVDEQGPISIVRGGKKYLLGPLEDRPAGALPLR